MRDELVSDDGRVLYRRRAQIIEPVFAHTKHVPAGQAMMLVEERVVTVVLFGWAVHDVYAQGRRAAGAARAGRPRAASSSPSAASGAPSLRGATTSDSGWAAERSGSNRS
jgi:hypothetical protein